jgi:hypothetical protein
MDIVSAVWGNADRTVINATRANGDQICVPVDESNRDYRLITQGRPSDEDNDAVAPLVIADYEAPAVSIEQVRAEAGRRLSSTDWLVIRAADPSAQTAVPQDVLVYRGAVRAASQVLEESLAADFADDAHWPAQVD